jgi:transposase InsO family protein
LLVIAGQPSKKGVLRQSLESGQYRATDYRDLLKEQKIVCSMSAKGCCWDNAVVESFISTLKLEQGLDDNRDTLMSPQQLQRDLSCWIEGYYNRERRHSTIGYLSPVDYEQRFIAAPTLIPVNP